MTSTHRSRTPAPLQFPSSWARRLVRLRTNAPLTRVQRWTFVMIMVLLPTYPIPWLLRQPVLLAVFAVSALAWYLGQWLHFCRRCQTWSCRFNRAATAGHSATRW